jgi:L-threonylcarbamoyladenylate synthase
MTEILVSDDAGIARAASLLRSGKLVSFGTETVYGLGGDARNGEVLARIFETKGRPRFNPLICHYANTAAAFADVIADARAQKLASLFWPGPLTLVLPRAPGCAVHDLASCGLPSLAVRVPSPNMVRRMLALAGTPIAAPSANISGHVSPTCAAHVLADFGNKLDAVLDTGAAEVGLESTILDLTGAQPVLLRPGGVPREALEAAIGPLDLATAGRAIVAPGMLASHYAPSVPLRLNIVEPAADEAYLAFGAIPPGAQHALTLSKTRDMREAARHLFAALRELDAMAVRYGLRGIAVAPIMREGLGAAIEDRLRRAAAPR